MANMKSLMLGSCLVLIHADPASAETRQFANIVKVRSQSPVGARYDYRVGREFAHEILSRRAMVADATLPPIDYSTAPQAIREPPPPSVGSSE